MDTKNLAKVFKALSNQNRLELYFHIFRKHETSFETGECLITDIIGSLNIGAPTISHHLKELTNAELIFTERKGKYLVCKANEKLLQEIIQTLSLYKD